MLDDDGQMMNPKDWPEDLARAVKAIRVSYTGRGEDRVQTIEPIFHNKNQALALLFAHKQLLSADNEHSKPALYLEVTRADE